MAYPEQALNLAVAHALDVELQGLDDVVAINLAADFGHRVVVPALPALKPLPFIDYATFSGFSGVAFRAGGRIHWVQSLGYCFKATSI
ncbi:hypothetical protein GCM10022409_05440 [Hymenobacter glaciei]|uniref:Uncharacterized protein n=1 Tax=Hymenobacter glaciei TaxID=877209 RepID=A0ABP7TCV4_9BACT